ncbi:hypothetical protein [Georgenia satyanarayanai]|uniref:hypothetical protein n=1 Tax=Georgenia satyanarayanai TaxID=860221 RepID=UPI001264E658|nr:hypothetical protein [Georgenia satyanarayanai]
MTWWLWLLLVLAALALYAVIGLGLWRRVKVLLAELRGLEQLSERLAAVTGAEPPAPIVPSYLAPPAEVAEARHLRQDNLRARRERRAARAAQAMARWRRVGLR